MPRPLVPFDPSSSVMLTIQGRTITRNLESMIRLHHHIRPLRKYYCKQFHWSSSVFDTVDWESFSMVYQKFSRTCTFFSKFGWKELPTGGRLHERTPSYDHQCPPCHLEFESDDHVFHCEHVLRKYWRSNLSAQLEDSFASFLDADLLAIIHIGLRSYFEDGSPNFSERFPAGYSSTPYAALINEQSNIGWDHFIRGKLSGEWAQLQYSYAKQYGLLKTSEGWLITLIKLLANSSFTLWDIRNGCRHGHDPVSIAQAAQVQAHRELRTIYHLRDEVLPQDRHLFRTNVELHLTEPVHQIRDWLTHNKQLIVFSVKTAQKQRKLKTHALHRYFRGAVRKKSSISKTRSTPSQPSGTKPAPKLRPSRMSSFFPISHSKSSRLPVLPENRALSNAALLQPRQRSLSDFFPDHPG